MTVGVFYFKGEKGERKMRHLFVVFALVVSLSLAIGAGLTVKQFMDNSLNARVMVEKEMQR